MEQPTTADAAPVQHIVSTPALPFEAYYRDDSVTIYNMDCRKALPWLGVFDLVLTDMPYGEVNRESGGLRNLDKRDADTETLHPLTVVDLIEGNVGGSVYIWCGTEQVSELRKRMVHYGMTTRVCVWEKTNPSPMNGEHFWLSAVEVCAFGRRSQAAFNERCKSPVFRHPSGRDKIHPTEKPLPLFRELLAASSDEGGSVLDPFMGSGTTLLAAKQEGRRAVGIEINERYCEKAADRLRQGVLF